MFLDVIHSCEIRLFSELLISGNERGMARDPDSGGTDSFGGNKPPNPLCNKAAGERRHLRIVLPQLLC
jgi:hypothetical protein